jgi:diguanylate cyclase
MNYPENTEEAAGYLKKAIPLMVSNQIPANPINYTLWYTYVTKKKPELNQALDQITKSNGSYTSESSRNLYLHYIIREEQHQSLAGITDLATQLIQLMATSLDNSNKFDQDLSKNIESLKSAKSLTDVSSIIDNVVATTQVIRTANDQYKSNIEQANEEIADLKKQLEQTQQQAFIDKLTQLPNRQSFDTYLSEQLEDINNAQNLFLILVDLDHFKSFNDDYGHVIGDRVLQCMGGLISDNCPTTAFGARYGGEEFAIIMPNSNEAEAIKTAETLRKKLNKLRVKITSSNKVLDNMSASFGIARYQANESSESFIDRTDKMLYQAKNNGRNRVEIATDITSTEDLLTA